ncbi:MAG: electron transfer flavoprotein subunit beta [Nitrospirae bacterium CG08_land_8_20_14_0_20_52_24]|nr:MAG: electron transfer flavoprotein subunit beta [Nitrospirae bacterium CG2_30_53_67]PIS37781.1 MAG: electron transfer flavoprotein subunit beta [Nitrospirae bacterium CG08_land_8_20_14_0_20_52_24]PIV85287.1 MAG: electron transfer flavoprotein subunit beta [Nitrospirae bacterium CG17_big_fil_post_rev_8_21_14_2_50_50_9]
MKIIVCVKQVPDTAARIRIASSGREIDTADLTYVVNPYDEYAVEEALRIKEKAGGEVIVISMGPDRAAEAVRTALAMGADRGIHLKDVAFEGSDPYTTAKLLAKVISGMEYDLILCGKQAVDDDASFVGPALAEFLGIPQATVITKLDLSEDRKSITVEREVEGGKEALELPLPALVTAQKGLNEPRYASLPGIMKAKKKEIKVMDAASAGISPDEVGEKGAKQKLLSLSLPAERKGGKVIPGEPKDAVKELVRLLKEEAKAL